jgi:hypothetical protein
MPGEEVVRSVSDLVRALDGRATGIRIDGTIQGLGTLGLPVGVVLEGGTLLFGGRGIILGLDTALEGVEVTHADGAVGIQVARPMPKLMVRRDVRTECGSGISLVRGEQAELEAIALSVKAGGSFGDASVGGRLERAATES